MKYNDTSGIVIRGGDKVKVSSAFGEGDDKGNILIDATVVSIDSKRGMVLVTAPVPFGSVWVSRQFIWRV